MRASEEAQAETSWLRPHVDSGETRGTIWTLPREPREARSADRSSHGRTAEEESRGPRGEIQVRAWGKGCTQREREGTCLLQQRQDGSPGAATATPAPVPCGAKDGSCCAACICPVAGLLPSLLLAESPSPTGCAAGSGCPGNVCWIERKPQLVQSLDNSPDGGPQRRGRSGALSGKGKS